MEQLNPIDIVLNFTKSTDALLAIGIPIGLLLGTFLIYFFFLQFNRHAEKQQILELEREAEEALKSEKAAERIATPEHEPEPEPESEKTSERDLILNEIEKTDKTTWLGKLSQGLSKTRDNFSKNLLSIFSGKSKLDDETLEKVHELLFRADVGVKTADQLVEHLNVTLKKEDKEVDWPEIKSCLQTKVSELLTIPASPKSEPKADEPKVILVIGVNGVGKTTSIGKLTAYFLSQGKNIILGAADTYRAAAIEQLKVWGDRLDVEVVAHQQGSDPAAVAFDAVKAAKSRKKDILIIDTAGRLHNKEDLMNELSKINKVIDRELPGAPHETWLVIDATTGQNAFQQVKAFKEVVDISGIVVTKLDGTAKGGVVIGVGNQFQVPVKFIGVGEKAADLRPFDPSDFATSVFS